MAASVVVGGSSGIGRNIAERLAGRGDTVVITSRSADRAADVASLIGPSVRGLALDLARPQGIATALADVGEVDNLVITAIAQFPNSLAELNIEEAITAVTVKLVGYAETVRVLREHMNAGASVVLFGGTAKDRPYPGSLMVTTANAGVSGLVRTLAAEMAPHRVNAIHPGIVGDSPRWRDVPEHPAIARTPIGRLVTMDEVTDAALFLLGNAGVNAVELNVNGGVLIA